MPQIPLRATGIAGYSVLYYKSGRHRLGDWYSQRSFWYAMAKKLRIPQSKSGQYWLIKSEPEEFSIDDLMASPDRTTHWDGVRNYQARNTLRDQMKKGDFILFYHSNADPPAVAGVAQVVRAGYPDFTAFDPEHPHYDPKSKPELPTWYMVDVKFIERFSSPLGLDLLKKEPDLQQMVLLQKGSRLSVQPVSRAEFELIVRMGQA